MKEVVKYLRDIGILLVLVWLVWNVTRWLTGPTVSPEQARTIDSLRAENLELDSALALLTVDLDSIRQASQNRERRESVRHRRQLDSLEALIPDTATMVPINVHQAIVATKDQEISLYRALWITSDSALATTRTALSRFQTQNAALLVQVNDLEDKANPGLFRRLKYAAPFIATLYGACKLGVLKCDS